MSHAFMIRGTSEWPDQEEALAEEIDDTEAEEEHAASTPMHKFA